jgi:hypothetical protein
VFKCTVPARRGRGNRSCLPGWTADPFNGTIPTGYLIFNVTQGTLKRHAGGFSWEINIGATGGKIGFYSLTPVTQPLGADQAPIAPRRASSSRPSFDRGPFLPGCLWTPIVVEG